jgi:bacterioferritin-associated ferredoxin
MDPDQHVCLCFRVSLRKLRTFMDVTKPAVASQLSECFSAGTGCQWCVPFLRQLHEAWQEGRVPDVPIAPAEYADRRRKYRERRAAGAAPSDARADATDEASGAGDQDPSSNSG